MNSKTIIIGGGMAGMSCALQLQQANEDFLLITDVLGGRVKYSEEAKVNFGAYFVMATYHYAQQIVSGETLLKPTQVCFHNSSTERFGVLSWRTIRYLPEFIRFYFCMREFSTHYEPYKQRCLSMPQKDALQADPYMAEIFSMPAAQFIRKKNFERVSEDYVAKFTYACTGISTDQITALDFLNVCTGMIVPIRRIRFDAKKMAQKLGKHLAIDTITMLEKCDGKFCLTSKSGETYTAENVVVATPAFVTQKLVGMEEIRTACKLYVYHVQAKLKPIYTKYDMNLFPNTSEIILTARQWDGSFLIYTREKEADLLQVCDSFTLIRAVDWEHAMYVAGSAYLEQEYGNHLYVAGDHNGLGLEPAAISGIYAANQIIQQKVAPTV